VAVGIGDIDEHEAELVGRDLTDLASQVEVRERIGRPERQQAPREASDPHPLTADLTHGFEVETTEPFTLRILHDHRVRCVQHVGVSRDHVERSTEHGVEVDSDERDRFTATTWLGDRRAHHDQRRGARHPWHDPRLVE
jgi:hypothetical protein